MEKMLFTSQIILLVIVILLILYTIHYVRQLKTCVCFQQNDKEQTNLNFLEFYEYLELFSAIIVFLGLMAIKPMKKNSSSNGLSVILLLLIVIIYFVIKYNVLKNVYKLSKGIKESCDCSNKWERFFLYYQGIVSAIEIVQYVIVFLMTALMSISALV